jgi:hypothetical protein
MLFILLLQILLEEVPHRILVSREELAKLDLLDSLLMLIIGSENIVIRCE